VLLLASSLVLTHGFPSLHTFRFLPSPPPRPFLPSPRIYPLSECSFDPTLRTNLQSCLSTCTQTRQTGQRICENSLRECAALCPSSEGFETLSAATMLTDCQASCDNSYWQCFGLCDLTDAGVRLAATPSLSTSLSCLSRFGCPVWFLQSLLAGRGRGSRGGAITSEGAFATSPSRIAMSTVAPFSAVMPACAVPGQVQGDAPDVPRRVPGERRRPTG